MERMKESVTKVRENRSKKRNGKNERKCDKGKGKPV